MNTNRNDMHRTDISTTCNCFSKHNFLYFLAGAAFWEALIHVSLHFSGALPLNYWGYTITPTNNMYIIIIAGLISVGALWFARCDYCTMRSTKA